MKKKISALSIIVLSLSVLLYFTSFKEAGKQTVKQAVSVEKKLTNERFVQNAKPEVLAMEQKKKADAEARIKTIEESLSTIS